jgi:RIH domain.
MQNPFMMEKNLEKFETIQTILEKYETIMFITTTIKDDNVITGPSQTIGKDRQIMCFHLYLHDHIINLIRDGMYTLNDIYDDPKNNKEYEGRSRILKLYKTCFSVLTNMVKNNSKIQKKFYKHLNVFTMFLKIPVGQEELICEIFRNNVSLCSSVKEDFLNQFLDLIVSEGRQARFLKFFEVIQSPNGVTLHEIQRIVLLKLLNQNLLNHVCYLNSENTAFSFEPTKNPPLFSPHYKDEPVVYHAILIRVLTICGRGVSGIYLNEAKCQKIITLEHLFEILNKDDSVYEILKSPLLEFFYDIYLDSEQKVEELETSKEFMAFIEKMTLMLSYINSEKDVNLSFFEA